MDRKQIKTLITGKDYDFLRTNEHLKDRLVFLTLGGSHAYGTNIEGSDVDVRGCALNRPADLIGLSNFEQVVHTGTDTTIYSFNKLVKLLVDCNPNVIEMLGCKPEHYLFFDQTGKELIENRKLFLSKRAVYSFGGYANQQLRRLENAIARDRVTQEKKEEHILRSMQHAVEAFEKKYTHFDAGSITLSTGESTREELTSEVFADIHLEHYPAREFNSVLNELSVIIAEYEKLNRRNKKKDDAHLNKHAMHLIRLYLTGLDILEKEEIVTYREKEHDLLMRIRRGEYQNEDGTYRSEFFDMVNEYEKRLEYAKNNTGLPDHPDMHRVEEFVMSVNRRALDAEN